MDSELDFEKELIHYLESIGGTKQWQYMPDINNLDDLWRNFRTILERNNVENLNDVPLSDMEFAQVKSVIRNLGSPYEAGRWIYGMNGVTQVEVDRDDMSGDQSGRHIFLTVFDQSNVGAGNTVYQIVNQIERPSVLVGRKDRRFDTTLLINGLPIIHIEEKFDHHDAREALRQIRQYIDEGAFTDIYSTVQILVGLTPHQALYMANTDSDSFNTDFAFHWQKEEDSKTVSDWREFANLMLSIPMAHQMATNYLILDGDPKHKALIVMRPYQVYATKKVVNALKSHVFGTDEQEIGYVWHTTGSGKTICSFKTAWLASRLPGIDKVVFLVDRIALTKQTFTEYQAYDPDADDENENGVVSDTSNTGVLAQKLKSHQKANSIIVTSIQKLGKLCKRGQFRTPTQKVVFIVDEAHRSTNGDMLKRIKSKFPLSAWVGYTGTPAFEGDLTHQAFGNLLHAYTIREAIADRSVLGFKVDFDNTLEKSEIKERLLPELLHSDHPNWTNEMVELTIAHMAPEEVDKYIDSGIYDNNEKHVEEVVEDIVNNWQNRSKEGKYGSILTTHVGGMKPSFPMALQYFEQFQRKNHELAENGKKSLNVAVTFSYATDNSEHQLDNNKGLRAAMEVYNRTFGMSFNDQTVSDYFSDVMERLKGKSQGPKLDIVIVIDQLLTGYNAPRVNTLYVDRTLSGANLIQAYSRTNRIENNKDKPWGCIVNYRWPETSKHLMDAALSVYANRDSALVHDSLGEDLDGVLAKPYEEMVQEAKGIVHDIDNLTDGFTDLPPSESSKQQLIDLINRYGNKVSQLKQCTEYDYDQPEVLLKKLGISADDEAWITNSAPYDLKQSVQETQEGRLDLSLLDFSVEHIAEVKINYDYIDELLAQIINETHQGRDVTEVYDNFVRATDQMEDRHFANQMKTTANAAIHGDIVEVAYPVHASDIHEIVRNHANMNKRQAILNFKRKWGIIDVVSANLLISQMLKRHILGAEDIQDGDELNKLLTAASRDGLYQQDAEDEQIRNLSFVKYRNRFRSDFKKLADFIVANY